MVLENCLRVCVEELFRICEGRLLNNVEALLENKLYCIVLYCIVTVYLITIAIENWTNTHGKQTENTIIQKYQIMHKMKTI